MHATILLISLFISGNILAQQDIQLSLGTSNPFIQNTAAMGMNGFGEFSAGTRSQWTGVEGNPFTAYASISGLVGKTKMTQWSKDKTQANLINDRTLGKKIILGARMFIDKIGPFQRNKFLGNVAIHLPLTNTINFGAGLGLGLSTFSLNEENVSLQSSGDITYQNYLASSSSQKYIDANVGLVVYSKKLFVGISSTQFFNNTLRFSGFETQSSHNRHLYLQSMYEIYKTEKIKLDPFFTLKHSKNTPFTLDLGTKVTLKNNAWALVAYRFNSAFQVGVGVNLMQHLTIAYVFEASTGKTAGFGIGANEFQIVYHFGKKAPKPIIQEPIENIEPIEE